MILDELQVAADKNTSIIKHRRFFALVKNLVITKAFETINLQDVHAEKDLIIREMNNCEEEELFEKFEELAFYQDRYTELERFFQHKKGSSSLIKVSQEQMISNFQKNFDTSEESIHHHNVRNQKKFSQQKDINSSSSSSNKKNEHKYAHAGIGQAVFQFFQSKKKGIGGRGFKDLADNNLYARQSNRTFKKKIKKVIPSVQVKKLLEENRRLHDQLHKKTKQEGEINLFEKNVLRQERNRYLKRVQQLEAQLEFLARDNYKLKQIEKSSKIYSNQCDDGSRQAFYSAYHLSVRCNDLQKLHQRCKTSSRNSKLSKEQILQLIDEIPPIENKQRHSFNEELEKLNQKMKGQSKALQKLLDVPDDPNSPVIEQKDSKFYNFQPSNSSELNPNNSITKFSSFSLAQSLYNKSSMFLNASKNLLAMDGVISTRNKVAFFKKSLVLVREPSFEIAYKKSELDQQMRTIRLIFYVNNKADHSVAVEIDYDFDLEHYTVEVDQKLKRIPKNSQGRQIIIISLSPSSKTLNNVVDAHFHIGDRRYDLWAPVSFVEWKTHTLVDGEIRKNISIMPDRQFRNYDSLSKFLPLSQPIIQNGGVISAYLYGKSIFGGHEVKLSWHERELKIESSSIIGDFLAFILHHFK